MSKLTVTANRKILRMHFKRSFLYTVLRCIVWGYDPTHSSTYYRYFSKTTPVYDLERCWNIEEVSSFSKTSPEDDVSNKQFKKKSIRRQCKYFSSFESKQTHNLFFKPSVTFAIISEFVFINASLITFLHII